MMGGIQVLILGYEIETIWEECQHKRRQRRAPTTIKYHASPGQPGSRLLHRKQLELLFPSKINFHVLKVLFYYFAIFVKCSQI